MKYLKRYEEMISVHDDGQELNFEFDPQVLQEQFKWYIKYNEPDIIRCGLEDFSINISKEDLEKFYQDEVGELPKVATILKGLLKRDTADVFSTSDGLSIKSTQVNKFFKQFDITSKDLRGFKSNKLMTQALRALGKVDEKERKTKFNELLRKVAEQIGHLPTTLRKHYLLPEIEENFYKSGSIGRVQKI